MLQMQDIYRLLIVNGRPLLPAIETQLIMYVIVSAASLLH